MNPEQKAALAEAVECLIEDAIKEQLWADVDAELDELEEFVRKEVRKPLHARAPGGFNFRLKPKKGSA